MSVNPDTVPEAAVGLTAAFEGYRARPYRDVAGTWTIGYGSTRDEHGHPVTGATPPLTVPDALALLRRDLGASAVCIADHTTHPLSDPQRSALCSFIYNLGEGCFQRSEMLRLINAGTLGAPVYGRDGKTVVSWTGAAGQFPLYDHAGGVVVTGLRVRRLAEQKLFVSTLGAARQSVTKKDA